MILKKQQIYSIIILSVLLFLFSSNFVLALEAKYPPLPMLPVVTETSGIEDIIGYWIGFGIYIATTITMVSFAFGAVQFMVSAGNPSNTGEGRDRMISSIIGLVLIMTSGLILRTINPRIVEVTLAPLEGVKGIFYIKGSEKKSVPYWVDDSTEVVASGYNQIKYECENNNAPALLFWKYPKIGFDNNGSYNNVQIQKLGCGATTSVAPSFKMSYETPGVYFFLKTGCSGFSSEVNVLSGESISDPFSEKIKSIKIINDAQNKIEYGVIFHQLENKRGQCQIPIEGEGCHPVNIAAKSLDIYKMNKVPKDSGDGVIFYSEPWGWNTGVQGGKYVVSKNQVTNNWKTTPQNLIFNYQNVTVSGGYQQSCKTFKDCPGSIKIQGDYLVMVSSGGTTSGNQSMCQVFSQDVSNLNKTEAVTSGLSMTEVRIIPVIK